MKRFLQIVCALGILVVAGCAESAGQDESGAGGEEAVASTEQSFDARSAIASISDAIPIYQGAVADPDLSEHDTLVVRQRLGDDARVVTLTSDDSYAKIFYYYTIFLAQFRGYPQTNHQPPAPGSRPRGMVVRLNDAMADPFIPGETLPPSAPHVTLLVHEQPDAGRTIIRYVVASAPIDETSLQALERQS